MEENPAAQFLDLAKYDWLVSKSWNRLHGADLTILTEDQEAYLAEHETWIPGPVKLACGRTAAGVSIPGVFTRMGAMRCTGCCRALGYPQGKGSPKNDRACRVILGLGT